MKHMIRYEIEFQYIKCVGATAFYALFDIFGDIYHLRKE